MLIKIKSRNEIKPSEITDKQIYLGRRQFLKSASHLSIAAAAASAVPGLLLPESAEAGAKLKGIIKSPYSSNEEMNSYEDITSYNNFYEFSTDKKKPARLAKNFKTSPWKVKVDGEINKPGEYDLEDFIKPYQLQERIYRFRCVEAWSMVIPWVGIPLADIIKTFEPGSKARYVEFTTLYDPKQMPGQKRAVLQWPYVEALRIDEAMHPLSILAVGLYGEVLPNQNGAPLRLVVPWKYGFKNIKSIVRIRFTEKQPETTWNIAGPREYGFYANVNPGVDHPRWTQKKERRIGQFFKQKTQMFNGYEDQVASLYSGMDLTRFY
jgi:sulfoxide reductase catalytic subunit YedY